MVSLTTCTALVVSVALVLPFLPASMLITAGMPATNAAIDPDATPPTAGAAYTDLGAAFTAQTLSPDKAFPLVIRPVAGATVAFEEEGCEGPLAASSEHALRCLVGAHRDWIKQVYYDHGALLFRGFAVTTPREFEDVFVQLTYPLVPFDGVYLGTSPRSASIDGTKYVSTASNIPAWQQIIPHTEMSFLRTPPDQISFWAQTANEGLGGDTPLADFRQMWREMRPDVREAFKTNGIKYHRKYYSETSGGPALWVNHPSYSKSWQAMFRTDTHAEAERQAAAQGFACDWAADDTLILTHTMNASRVHPTTGESAWHNHFGVLHQAGWAEGHAAVAHRSADWQWRARNFFVWAALRGVHMLSQLLCASEPPGAGYLGAQVTYGDGSEIPAEHVAHVYALLWRNVVVEPWQNGDLAYLDNHRIAHGRSPFENVPRKVMVAWVQDSN